MSMKEWAENEIRIACERERTANGLSDESWDYGCACYESALKAFKSLLEDEHSGFSIMVTKGILNRLIDGKPLTPIEDTADTWNEISCHGEYQCKRYPSLFKTVKNDGVVEYRDIDQFICVNPCDTANCWTNGFVIRQVSPLFPIVFPYAPSQRPIKIFVEEFLYDEKNGDFDTIGILYAINDNSPENTKKEIYRYFKEQNNGFDEISHEEYEERKVKRKAPNEQV